MRLAHRFEHAEQWAPELDDPAREAWQRPKEVIDAMEIQPGMMVADIGAGTDTSRPGSRRADYFSTSSTPGSNAPTADRRSPLAAGLSRPRKPCTSDHPLRRSLEHLQRAHGLLEGSP